MKSVGTGVVRKVDGLGRIVLPKELRRILEIDIKGCLEIYVEDEDIILKKYQPGCIFCGETYNTINYKNKNICQDCLNKIKSE